MSEEGKDYTDLHNFKCITTKNRGGGSKSVSNLVFYAQSTITVISGVGGGGETDGGLTVSHPLLVLQIYITYMLYHYQCALTCILPQCPSVWTCQLPRGP